jgi:DNA-binding transcriptional MerR regulator
MISIEMGELYGMTSPEELIEAIDFLKNMGMSDAQIQEVLDRSKEGKEQE